MKFNKVDICLVLLSALYNTVDAVISTNATFQGYRKWAPANSTRNDMYCPENCYNNPGEDECCCCCRAVTCWELDTAACNVTVGQLSVEYKDVYGSAKFVSSENHTWYEAVHRNGRLTKFPDNLCDFADSLVKLDLSYNRIRNISDIRCLNKLDTIRLDGNKITEISNDTFSDMEYLRIVSLSRNNIETLQPNTNQKKNGNILMIDFSYNIVETIDITNIIRPGPFCNFSCEGCEVTEKTNLLSYVIDESNIHGPGDINLKIKGTSGEGFINFTTLGLNDYSMLGKYFKGRLNYNGSSVHCDCSLYPFFTHLGKNAHKYWPEIDNQDIICISPENMKGRNLTNMYQTQKFEELTCNIPDCPKNCICTDIPSDGVVKVKCTGLTSMPDFAPIGYWKNDRIDLDLSDSSNKISHFSNRNFVKRIITMDLTGNTIQTFDVNAIENLGENVQIDMSYQNLKTLPVAFNKLHPRRIKFGSHPVECDCDNLWIGDWIRYNKAQGSLQCMTRKGVVPAELVTTEFLECLIEVEIPGFFPVLLALLVSSIFVVSLLCYYFRYEIMLLKRKCINKKAKCGEFEFDAMLTFSVKNPNVFRWVERKIVPALKREGYSLFVPFYDIIFGGNRELEIAKGVGKSRNYVVFLCNKYLCDENSVQEFEILWKHFCMDTKKNIIVVNFDNFECSEIKIRRLRAFRIIREDLNFIERETKLFERLIQRLGPPSKLLGPSRSSR
ncbi:uncharacterized protein LOC128558014 [Mercenaria mercenaria]|uniref:uncharacterized protein LOC128558014 n=1 Tax=Mercenaria mercenaria TaxID=6596 RepID=UPI00234F52B5|nr:uncharacterized protein LOC128558014 [Mercenaria mercenaria]